MKIHSSLSSQNENENKLPRYFECEGCGCLHQWEFDGACQEEGCRHIEEDLILEYGVYKYVILSWEDRKRLNLLVDAV
jgi:hypothetical protein